MGKCRKCCKTKYDVRVKCKPAHDDRESDAGEWNLAIVPDPVNSSFRPSTNAETDGQFTTTTSVVDNQADFSAVGLGNATEADLFGTTYTLEQPAVANSVNGFSIYFTVISGASGNFIKFIQNDISYQSALTARVHNTNIVETGSTAPPATAEYEGWTFITQELAS